MLFGYSYLFLFIGGEASKMCKANMIVVNFVLVDLKKRPKVLKSGILLVRFETNTNLITTFSGFKLLPLFTFIGPIEDYLIMRLSPGHKTFFRRFYYVEWNVAHNKLIIRPITLADAERLTGINSYDF